MRKYRLVAKKGEGTFSEVLKAQNVKDGKYHAIKCMKNRFESIDQVNNLREIQALRRLSPHEHIISLEEVLYDQPTGRLALVFELMDANLYELIRGRKHYLNPSLIKSYMWQLMKSLDHMHKKGIFHRDIKPENILIESSTEVGRGLKLADFGSCRGIYSKQPYTEYISTRWYRAPECLLTDGYYGPEMDLWGAGCVMFEITSLYPLFPGANEVDQISRIHKVLGTPNAESLAKFRSKGASHISFDFPPQKGIGVPQLVPHASADSIDLMVKLLKYDASDRITAREAMRHPYFKDVRETEAKLLADSSKGVVASGTAPAASSNISVAASEHTKTSVGYNSFPSNENTGGSSSKPLPSISTNSDSKAANLAGNNSSSNATLMYEQQMMLLKQQSQNIKTNTIPPLANTVAGASSLPPIMGSMQQGGGAGRQYVEQKSARTMQPSHATQKRRRKAKQNTVQQQRSAQNTEGVMKAYGVAKPLNNTSGASGALESSRGLAPAPISGSNNGSGSGVGGSSAGVYGHPSRHYVAKK